jgi:hypothetical protein
MMPTPMMNTSPTPKTSEPLPNAGSQLSTAVCRKTTTRARPPSSGNRNRNRKLRAFTNAVRRKYQTQASAVSP